MVAYLQDRLDTRPALSSSIASLILNQSPLKAWARHPKLGATTGSEPSKETDRGDLIHALMLGVGKELVVVDAKDWRTNAAKDAREAAYAKGATPVLAHKLEDAQNVSAILTRRLEEHGIAFAGKSEQTIVWMERGVLCKGRLDHMNTQAPWVQVIDIKSTSNISPSSVQRSIIEYGYHVQAAAYTNGLRSLGIEKVDYVLAFVEMEAPFEVAPVELEGSMMELGERRWTRAIDIWKRCLDTGVWPGVAAGARISMPAPEWALARDLEEQLKKGGSDSVPF